MKISKNVLEKIKKDHISPRPKWQFTSWHILLWTMIGFAVIIGIAASSLLIRELFIEDWDIAFTLSKGNFQNFLVFLPYLWLVCIFGLMFASYKVFQLTPDSHHYNPALVVSAVVGISLLIALILHVSGLNESIDDFLREHIQPYASIEEQRERLFASPEKGILGGKITGEIINGTFSFTDISGKTWQINIAESVQPTIAPLPPLGTFILIQGNQNAETTFQATQIRPWRRANAKNSQKHFERKPTTLTYQHTERPLQIKTI